MSYLLQRSRPKQLASATGVVAVAGLLALQGICFGQNHGISVFSAKPGSRSGFGSPPKLGGLGFPAPTPGMNSRSWPPQSLPGQNTFKFPFPGGGGKPSLPWPPTQSGSSWGHGPGVKIYVPNNRYSGSRYYDYPRSNSPSVGSDKSLPTNSLPEPAIPAPTAVPAQPPAPQTPVVNQLGLTGRPITTEEQQRAEAYFSGRFRELAGEVERQSDAVVDVDQHTIMTAMVSQALSADTQIRIIDAVSSGDSAKARQLWLASLGPASKTDAVDSWPIGMDRQEIARELAALGDKLRGGTAAAGDLKAATGLVGGSHIAMELRAAILDLLSSIGMELTIREAICGATAGAAGSRMPLPVGNVMIIYNPRLPARSAVCLGHECVMVGANGSECVFGSVAAQTTLSMETGCVAEAFGLPVSSANPLEEFTDKPAHESILLVVRQDAPGEVAYRVDNHSFTMRSGLQQVVPATGPRSISFQRKPGGQSRRFALDPGTYEFYMTDEGWDLGYKTYEALVDNSENSQAFHYLVQDEAATVEPFAVNSHTSDYPIVIRFDRGDGQREKQVRVDTDRTLRVAVNSADNLWDLFAVAESTWAPEGTTKGSDFVPAF